MPVIDGEYKRPKYYINITQHDIVPLSIRASGIDTSHLVKRCILELNVYMRRLFPDYEITVEVGNDVVFNWKDYYNPLVGRSISDFLGEFQKSIDGG